MTRLSLCRLISECSRNLQSLRPTNPVRNYHGNSSHLDVKRPEGKNGGKRFSSAGEPTEAPLDLYACAGVNIWIESHDKLGGIIQLQAPQGRYRVIGRGRIDTMDSPERRLFVLQRLREPR